MAKQSFKKNKFEERLVNEINTIFRTKIVDPRLRFVTMTKAEVSPDFAYATIFWDTFDSKVRGDAKRAMNGIGSKVRSMLAGIMKIRHIPEITFNYDSQYESEQNIVNILNSEANIGKTF